MNDGSRKPTYVQVTDRRSTLSGWKLSVSQPEQFKTASGDELVGAQLKFTKGQAVSLVDPTYTPQTVNSELTLTPGGNNTLAINAKSGTGVGLGSIDLVQMKMKIKMRYSFRYPVNLSS